MSHKVDLRRVHRIAINTNLTATEKHLFGYLDFKRERAGNGFRTAPGELDHIGSPSKLSETFSSLINKGLVTYKNGFNNQRYDIKTNQKLRPSEFITVSEREMLSAANNVHAAMILHRWRFLASQGRFIIIAKLAESLKISLSTVKRWASKLNLSGQNPKTEVQNPKTEGQNPKTLHLLYNTKDNTNIKPPSKIQSILQEWIDYRKLIRKPLNKMAVNKVANKLSKYDSRTQQAMIDQSIENNWSGLFELKTPLSEVSFLDKHTDRSWFYS